MEKLLLRLLTVACCASVPFVFRRKNILLLLVVFFAKGLISTSLDSFFIKRERIEYPVRPLPKIFDTNILYDYLFYPLLSVIWVRWTYNTKLVVTLLRSLFFSVPMSIIQWFLERKTALFQWKSWSILHTFAYINLTLFLIKGMAWILQKMTEKEKPAPMNRIPQSSADQPSRLNPVFSFERLLSKVNRN